MKLQKQLSRKVGNVSYPKYVLVIPPKIVEESKLKEGEELKIQVTNKKMIISLK
jgi:antitoxin component of MazEF toxin-antitoxin module